MTIDLGPLETKPPIVERVENIVANLVQLSADLSLHNTLDNRQAALGAVSEAIEYAEGLSDTLTELRDALLQSPRSN
jgi:hypothetical protein